jgi:hypothetical protein
MFGFWDRPPHTVQDKPKEKTVVELRNKVHFSIPGNHLIEMAMCIQGTKKFFFNEEWGILIRSSEIVACRVKER